MYYSFCNPNSYFMKTKSLILTSLFAATALVFSCSGDKHNDHSSQEEHHHDHASGSSATAEAQKPQFEVDKKFREQLTEVFDSYVDLQEAFVASNVKEVQQEASETVRALKEVDMTLLSGAAHNDWMVHVAGMESSLDAIRSDEDIESQRKSFSALTDHLYKSVKAFGLNDDQAYYTYCPMAFNNEGGYWLADEEKISNPYFGDKMLRCGHVKEKLQ